jgi:hypothetical protein
MHTLAPERRQALASSRELRYGHAAKGTSAPPPKKRQN